MKGDLMYGPVVESAPEVTFQWSDNVVRHSLWHPMNIMEEFHGVAPLEGVRLWTPARARVSGSLSLGDSA